MNQARRGEDELMLAPQAMTNSATVTANLDCKGCGHVTIRIPFAAELNTNAVGPTIALSESDDTVVTNFATVTASRTGEDLTAAKELRYEIDRSNGNRKRYLRLSVTTATATNDNVTLSAIATKSANAIDPISTSDMADVVVSV